MGGRRFGIFFRSNFYFGFRFAAAAYRLRMNESRTDFELLQDFIRKGDQGAFAEVVRRHLSLVYATALRKTEDNGAEEEVAQNVFNALARKAWRFAPDDSLPAWLYKTTLLEAKEWVRGELRRRRREQTAAELGTTMKNPDEHTAYRALLPLLDEALLSLREKDRTALLLRFYESQSLREVGAAFGTSEDTAQKRVAGALEKLSQFFQRRGFKTASAAAATAALQHTASSASAAMVTQVANAALHAAPPALTGLGAVLARLASLTKVQTAALCIGTAALPMAWQAHALGTAKQERAVRQSQFEQAAARLNAARDQNDQLQSMSLQADDTLAKVSQLNAENAEALQKLSALKDRLHGMFSATDYRWPDDLAFVRVPRSAVDNVQPSSDMEAFAPSGRLSSWTVQLVGIHADERAFMESNLAQYLLKINELAEQRVYETNSPYEQPGWVAKTFVTPDLGTDQERLWVQFIDPIVRKLGTPRANRFESFWGMSISGRASYPMFDKEHTQPPRQMMFAIKPDGTETPAYQIYGEGMLRTGRLPMRDDLPEYLKERFEPWLRGLGVSEPFSSPQP
jgi:RNA polymerase sigma factor (sigma-70 family)